MHPKKFALALHSRDAATGRLKLRSAFGPLCPSALLLILGASIAGCERDERTPIAPRGADAATVSETRMNPATLAEGKRIFRFDTYGDETFWTDTLRMHEVISTSVSPATALSVGLKVDADALPPEIVAGIKNRTVDLNSPATAVSLDGRQLVRGRYRPSARRMAEPGPQPRRDHRALARADTGAASRLHLVGSRDVRSAVQYRWTQHAGGDSAGLRPPAREA